MTTTSHDTLLASLRNRCIKKFLRVDAVGAGVTWVWVGDATEGWCGRGEESMKDTGLGEHVKEGIIGHWRKRRRGVGVGDGWGC